MPPDGPDMATPAFRARGRARHWAGRRHLPQAVKGALRGAQRDFAMRGALRDFAILGASTMLDRTKDLVQCPASVRTEVSKMNIYYYALRVVIYRETFFNNHLVKTNLDLGNCFWRN